MRATRESTRSRHHGPLTPFPIPLIPSLLRMYVWLWLRLRVIAGPNRSPEPEFRMLNSTGADGGDTFTCPAPDQLAARLRPAVQILSGSPGFKTGPIKVPLVFGPCCRYGSIHTLPSPVIIIIIVTIFIMIIIVIVNIVTVFIVIIIFTIFTIPATNTTIFFFSFFFIVSILLPRINIIFILILIMWCSSFAPVDSSLSLLNLISPSALALQVDANGTVFSQSITALNSRPPGSSGSASVLAGGLPVPLQGSQGGSPAAQAYATARLPPGRVRSVVRTLKLVSDLNSNEGRTLSASYQVWDRFSHPQVSASGVSVYLLLEYNINRSAAPRHRELASYTCLLLLLFCSSSSSCLLLFLLFCFASCLLLLLLCAGMEAAEQFSCGKS